MRECIFASQTPIESLTRRIQTDRGGAAAADAPRSAGTKEKTVPAERGSTKNESSRLMQREEDAIIS